MCEFWPEARFDFNKLVNDVHRLLCSPSAQADWFMAAAHITGMDPLLTYVCGFARPGASKERRWIELACDNRFCDAVKKCHDERINMRRSFYPVSTYDRMFRDRLSPLDPASWRLGKRPYGIYPFTPFRPHSQRAIERSRYRMNWLKTYTSPPGADFDDAFLAARRSVRRFAHMIIIEESPFDEAMDIPQFAVNLLLRQGLPRDSWYYELL